MRSGTHPIARRAVAGLIAAVALVVPAQAGAATSASISSGTLNVDNGSEPSDITVTSSGDNIVVGDALGNVTATGGCVANGDSPKKAVCPALTVTALGSVLGAGADKLDTSAVGLPTNVNAGAGADVITTGTGNDGINGDLDGDTIDGGLGNDNLVGGDGGDTVTYKSHTAAVTVALGTGGNGQTAESDGVYTFEYMVGGSGNDTLSGDGNDNFISGGTGSDAISGGGGNDYVGYWERADDITVQLAQGATPGTGGATAGGESDAIAPDVESAMGGAGDDVVIGNDSANVLWGGWSAGTAGPDGDDVLRGKGGADTLWGDQGNDIADYSDKTSGITASLDGSSNDPDGDSIHTDIEGLAGGSGNDTLTGNSSANVVRGGPGDDTINTFGGNDVIDGGTGADSFTGGPDIDRVDYSGRTDDLTIDIDGVADDAGEGDNVKADVENVTGGSGNDTLTGGTAANTLDGGPGADTLRGAGAADTYTGGSGVDTVSYADKASASASIDGLANDTDGDNVGTDVENLVGSGGSDTLSGDGDANSLVGGAGIDTLSGGGGNDTLQGGTSADVLNGGAGTDTADYSDRTTAVVVSLDGVAGDADGDTIAADVENATGGTGDDTLTGGAGANRLTGGQGVDTLTGAGGTDFIDAGAGADVIAARDGASDSVLCGDGADSGEVDSADILSLDCESAVEAPAPALAPPVDPPAEDPPVEDPPPADPAPTDPPAVDTPSEDPPVDGDKKKTEAPVAIKMPRTVRINSKGVLPVKVQCTAETGTCRGKIELFEENGAFKARAQVTASRRRKASRKRRAIRLGVRKFSVAAGKQKTVPLRLDRRGRRRVIQKKKGKSRRRRRGKIVISMRAPNGSTVTTVKHVTIQPPKQRRTARRATGRRRGR